MEKERRTKALILSTLVVVVATLSIAFAAMSRTLNINGIAKMDTASWSVYFANLSEATTVRGAKEEGKPNISVDKGTIENIKVKLSNPKDEISYTVDIVNDGTIDAKITMIKDIELTDAQKKIFEFKVTYSGTNNILKDGDLLPAGDTKNITITIRFRDDIEPSDLPSQSQTINLSYQITYTQYDGNDGTLTPDGEGTTPELNYTLADSMNLSNLENVSDPFEESIYNGTVSRNTIESISFVKNKNVPESASSTVWNASSTNDDTIIGWYEDTDSNNLYEVYIGSNGNIYAPSDSSFMFSFFENLKQINFNNFNTSNVTNMYGMFTMGEDNSSVLESLDLSSFDTSNVTDMSVMFYGRRALTSIDVSSFNTENVTSMMMMFAICPSLTSLNVKHFNTENVTDMNHMFAACEGLTTLDLGGWDTSNVTDMSGMFTTGMDGMNLTSIVLTGWDTSNVTNMSSMFSACEVLENLDLSSFTTTNLTNMEHMFSNCYALKTVDFRNADFTNVTDYGNVFQSTEAITQFIVKDTTQKNLMLSRFSDINFVAVSEL